MKLKAVLLSILFACTALVCAQDKEIKKFVGKKMPAFSIKTITGKTITNKTIKGKAVLIDCWALWCSPCVKLAPTMNGFHNQYSKKGLMVIGANVSGATDSKEKVAAYVKKHNYAYTFTYNSDSLGKSLKVDAIPAAIIVNKKGIIVAVVVGNVPNAKADLEAGIKKALK